MASEPPPDTTERPMSETTAFPTFLDTDPYPTSTPDGRPTSSASAWTDASSEFGGNADDFASAKERQSNIPSTTGPVGESGLPPSRPTSVGTTVASSQRGTRGSQGPPSSRRGLAAFAARSGGSLRNSADGAAEEGGRPGSAMSKTHIPYLTAGQGFFRPMSSQKLQAQRAQRPSSSLAQNVTAAGEGVAVPRTNRRSEDSETRRHRYSNASVSTLRDGLPPPGTRTDEEVPPLPVSRGTIGTADGLGGGMRTAGSVVSNTDSTVPLHQQHSRQGQDALPPNLRVDAGSTSNLQSPPPKSSPRSLRASLGLSSRRTSGKGDAQDRRPSPSHAHEKLSSNPSSPQMDGSEKPLPFSPIHRPSPPAGKRKNYEYFAGNLLFFLNGRLLNTRAKPLNLVTFILTALPAALFFGFEAPFLWHHVSPALPIIFAYVFFITMSAFCHAAFSDPGILPRNLHPHPVNPAEEADPLTPGPRTTEWVMVKTFPSARAKYGPPTDVEAGQPGMTAMEVPTKYCKACSIWRPARAHHCRICDACVETQDHHCVWLNNCVGRRNYRFFFSYVGLGSLLAILLIAFSLTHVGVYAKQHHTTFGRALGARVQERVAFAMFIYAILALPYPGSLFIYHCFLISRGETTREYLNSHKFLPKDRHRPFSQGTWRANLVAVIARPRPPSYMQFRKGYRNGDVRFGHTAPKRERKAELKGRYSVGGRPNGVKADGEGKEKGMEMKRLSTRFVDGFKGKGRGGGGVGVNSTPR